MHKKYLNIMATTVLTCIISVVAYGWSTDCENTAGLYVYCEG